jgi:hypothetical protein
MISLWKLTYILSAGIYLPRTQKNSHDCILMWWKLPMEAVTGSDAGSFEQTQCVFLCPHHHWPKGSYDRHLYPLPHQVTCLSSVLHVTLYGNHTCTDFIHTHGQWGHLNRNVHKGQHVWKHGLAKFSACAQKERRQLLSSWSLDISASPSCTLHHICWYNNPCPQFAEEGIEAQGDYVPDHVKVVMLC